MKRSHLSYFIPFALWSLLLLLWPAPTEMGSPSNAALGQGEGLYRAAQTEANFGLMGIRFFETDTNRKRWNIRSQFAELHRKDNYAYLQQVAADFFAEKTGNRVTTQSNYGKCFLEKDEVDLEGAVSIQSKRGYLFEMERLRYFGRSHTFSSQDLVQMKGPQPDRPTMTLSGLGLLAEIDRESFVLKKQVQALRKLKSNDWLRIQSNSGEFHTEDQRAIFLGNVRSQLPLANIQSQKLEIAIANETESILASGNVTFTTKKRSGKADKLSLEAGSSLIILEGHASIEANDNQIRGRRILLYSDEDRIEVEGAEGRISK